MTHCDRYFVRKNKDENVHRFVIEREREGLGERQRERERERGGERERDIHRD